MSDWSYIIGQNLLVSASQFSLGSIALSSTYSVINFSKTQEILDNGVSALRKYLYVAIAWLVANCLVMYSQFKYRGVLAAFVFNLVYIVWIVISYQQAFDIAAKQNGLIVRGMFEVD